ncbi:MAG TPA: DUF4838 domain-containing protein [Candidatus Latescibacteria bacterium]|nr:DUF4838 domain-containing protein [Candidatus Latescibacterota bacterium]
MEKHVLMFAFLFVSAVQVRPSRGDVVLVRGGRPMATVVVPKDAPEEVVEAARTLVEYVRKSTGASLEVRTYKEGLEGTLVHVGDDPYVRKALPELQRLDEDGLVIRAVDRRNLIIAGSTPLGTEYGVYEFLERFVGVRWLMPGPYGEHVPKLEDVVVPTVEIWEEPAFLTRDQVGLVTEEQRVWGRRMKLRRRFQGSGHNISSIFPPEKYTKTHPEFYPIVGEKRLLPPSDRYWKWHPCFTAEGIAEEAAKNITEYFRQHPEERSYSIAVNDGPVVCECEGCMRANGHRRNWLGNRHMSETFFAWANRVAELVMEEFPDRWLGCLSYTNTFDPPSFKVHPRIVVYHCYDRHKWIHPEVEREEKEIEERWCEVCQNMAWYDYTFGASFMAPRVYFHHMANYLRYARDIGVKGMLGESCHNWAEGPKWYVMAKLYWNPDLDVDELLRDWYDKAVGPEAAPYLAKYYELWEKFWTERLIRSEAFSTEAQQWLPIQDDKYFDIMRMEDFKESRRLLEEALARTRTPEQRRRAEMLLKGFEYYEASAMARLPDHEAGRAVLSGPEDALVLVERAPDALRAAKRRKEIHEALSKDPIMLRQTLDWPATERSGWGAYPLWRAMEWIASDRKVRRKVEDMARSDDPSLASHAEAILNIIDGEAEPLEGAMLVRGEKFVTLVVGDDTKLSSEPGEGMDYGHWQLTVGDDVIPFWNAPHPGRSGKMWFEPSGGRSGRGMVVCEGVKFGTVRRKYRPVVGTYTGLCFVRVPEGTEAEVVLNVWEIALADGNPSPCRTVAHPQPGAWTPVAVTAELKGTSCYSRMPVDYVLLELEVQGLEEGERLEVSDMAMWPWR